MRNRTLNKNNNFNNINNFNKAKFAIFFAFFALFAFFSSLNTFALENEYKNTLTRIEVKQADDTNCDINLYLQKKYFSPVKIIKKNDLSYYILLPETKNSSSNPVSNAQNVKNITTASYKYAGADTNNGYTKINISTQKPMNFNVNIKNSQDLVSSNSNSLNSSLASKAQETVAAAKIKTAADSENIEKKNSPSKTSNLAETQKTAQKPVQKTAEVALKQKKELAQTTQASKQQSPKQIGSNQQISKQQNGPFPKTSNTQNLKNTNQNTSQDVKVVKITPSSPSTTSLISSKDKTKTNKTAAVSLQKSKPAQSALKDNNSENKNIIKTQKQTAPKVMAAAKLDIVQDFEKNVKNKKEENREAKKENKKEKKTSKKEKNKEKDFLSNQDFEDSSQRMPNPKAPAPSPDFVKSKGVEPIAQDNITADDIYSINSQDTDLDDINPYENELKGSRLSEQTEKFRLDMANKMSEYGLSLNDMLFMLFASLFSIISLILILKKPSKRPIRLKNKSDLMEKLDKADQNVLKTTKITPKETGEHFVFDEKLPEPQHIVDDTTSLREAPNHTQIQTEQQTIQDTPLQAQNSTSSDIVIEDTEIKQNSQAQINNFENTKTSDEDNDKQIELKSIRSIVEKDKAEKAKNYELREYNPDEILPESIKQAESDLPTGTTFAPSATSDYVVEDDLIIDVTSDWKPKDKTIKPSEEYKGLSDNEIIQRALNDDEVEIVETKETVYDSLKKEALRQSQDNFGVEDTAISQEYLEIPSIIDEDIETIEDVEDISISDDSDKNKVSAFERCNTFRDDSDLIVDIDNDSNIVDYENDIENSIENDIDEGENDTSLEEIAKSSRVNSEISNEDETKIEPVLQTENEASKSAENQSSLASRFKTPIPENPKEPVVLSNVPITDNSGFMCVKYNKNINLMGYIADDVFALYNFKAPNLQSYDIKFRKTDEKSTHTDYIVKVANIKVIIRVGKEKMTLMTTM